MKRTMYKNGDYIIDITYIEDLKYKTRKDGQLYLTFSADCDCNRFTIFNNIPGFKQLQKMYSQGINRAKVEMRWREISPRYNRCDGLIFDRKIK